MPNHRNTYCSHCGTLYPDATRYPRTCANPACEAQTWANPIPVSVLLVPIRVEEGHVGLLVVRRAIQPRQGLLALVGGFLEEHETYQAGGAREAMEEANVSIDPAGVEPFWFTSTEPQPNRVLLFSVAGTLDARSLPPFEPSVESSERGLIFGPGGLGEAFAFPLHVRAVERYFASKGIDGRHDYKTV
jgi:ADP-ribose pyrophosphatase YjhB (NUDIX family)